MMTPPVISARVTSAEPGQAAQAHFWCQHCERVHSHGAFSGLVAAHCFRKESPYRMAGYKLDLQDGVTALGDVMPEALFAGRRYLWKDLEGAAAGLRLKLLRHTLGGRVGHCFSKRIGRARISVFGNIWSFEPDAFPPNSESHTEKGCRRSGSEGQSLLTLLSALYGISAGIVGVRLFEAISGLPLDAQARSDMAALIEAASERQAKGRGGCQ